MRPRLVVRCFLRRPSKERQTALRTFTHYFSVLSSGRPQLPFLSIPLSSRQQYRYLTTERKRWLRYELFLGVKYTAYVWAMVGCVVIAAFALGQEWQEKQHPTPPEWSYMTRMRLRGAFSERNRKDVTQTDYVQVLHMLLDVLERLEDRKREGAGLEEASPVGGDDDMAAVDISTKSEPWRRAYFETLLAAAMAAEHVEGWVNDRTRKIVFPPEVVIGPSNPRPKPIPPGAKSAPREENCEIMFPSPLRLYTKLTQTVGLTRRQQMEVQLAFANWREFKGDTQQAQDHYLAAVDLAWTQPGPGAAQSSSEARIQDWARRVDSDAVSANLLMTLTAYAVFKARAGDVSAALPVLISLLKARRSLPPPSHHWTAAPAQRQDDPSSGVMQKTMRTIKRAVMPPEYPPPPDDGSSPPVRDAKELCEEGALQLHIGEIMYAARNAAREDGLAWTREAVDIAEEQLHKLGRASSDDEARATCRECLRTGIDNWATMVARLARDAEQKKEAGASKASWFGLWGDATARDHGRWAAEERVIKDRTRRAKELLEDLEPPAKGLLSFFSA